MRRMTQVRIAALAGLIALLVGCPFQAPPPPPAPEVDTFSGFLKTVLPSSSETTEPVAIPAAEFSFSQSDDAFRDVLDGLLAVPASVDPPPVE